MNPPDDFAITPPLLDERPPMSCGYAGTCPKDSTWHIFWNPQLDNSAACDEHYEASKRWAWYTAHRLNDACVSGDGRLVHLKDGGTTCIHPDDGAELIDGVERDIDLDTGRLLPSPILEPSTP